MVSAEVKEEYMTLQGIQIHCSQLTSQNPKTVKSHLSLTLMRVKLVLHNVHTVVNVLHQLHQQQRLVRGAEMSEVRKQKSVTAGQWEKREKVRVRNNVLKLT